MLDFLIRSWIHNTARQKVYEAARQAAAEQLNQGPDVAAAEQSAAQDKPCDIGLVLAPSIAVGAFEDRLPDVVATYAGGLKFRQAGLRGRQIACVEAGTEPESAARAAELLIAGHQPAWIISAGFAVAVKPDVKRGDFLLANEVCNAQGQALRIDLQLPATHAARGPQVYADKLISIHPCPRRPGDKEACGRTSGALAADVASYAVAEICRQEKARFLAVHIISDALHDEPPRDLKRLTKKKDVGARWGAALGALVNRPSTVKEMLDRKATDLELADRLARFLEGVLAQLPPAPNRSIETTS